MEVLPSPPVPLPQAAHTRTTAMRNPTRIGAPRRDFLKVRSRTADAKAGGPTAACRHATSPLHFPAHGAVPRTPFGRRLGNELLDRRGKSPALIRLYRPSPRCTSVGLPSD